MRDLKIFPDRAALAAAAADLVARLSDEATAKRGRSLVALSGGSTPRALFGLLAAAPYCDTIDWSRLQLFWSDERAVPPDDPQSNYGMARNALIAHVPVEADQVHRMPAEHGPLAEAANAYAVEIRRVAGCAGNETPRFDLIMLGMGEDGHTASLFPGTAALDATDQLVTPNYVPKLDARRMTFTPRLINAAANVLFLIAGADKATALAAVLEGPRDPRRYPAQLIAPVDGAVYWYLDAAAATRLHDRSG